MLKEKLKQFFIENNLDIDTTWINSLNINDSEEYFIISFPHKFFSKWFLTYKKNMFEYAMKTCCGKSELKIKYNDVLENDLNMTNIQNFDDNFIFEFLNLNKDSGFDNFLYNINNNFEVKTLIKVCLNIPNILYSPILISGNTGVGKTHLIAATAKKMIEKSNIKILFILPKRIKLFIDKIYSKHFLSSYNAIVIENIDEFIESTKYQSFLVDIIDLCYKKIQLIFSASDINNISKLNARLLTRIKNGLILNIKEPDIDVRLNYIKSYCDKYNILINDQQKIYLAQNSTTIRDINGLFLKLQSIIDFKKHESTNINLENIIKDKNPDTNIGYSKIINIVSSYFNIDIDDLMSNKRHSKLVNARQICMYLCKVKLDLSYVEIGKIFGNKDHSTVIYSVNKIKEKIKKDKEMASIVNDIDKYLY